MARGRQLGGAGGWAVKSGPVKSGYIFPILSLTPVYWHGKDNIFIIDQQEKRSRLDTASPLLVLVEYTSRPMLYKGILYLGDAPVTGTVVVEFLTGRDLQNYFVIFILSFASVCTVAPFVRPRFSLSRAGASACAAQAAAPQRLRVCQHV